MMGNFFGNGNGYAGEWDSMPDYMQNMMQNYYGGNQFFWQFTGVFHFVTWILLIILLVALIRWTWNKGNKAK
jgi:hypothetical protein